MQEKKKQQRKQNPSRGMGVEEQESKGHNLLSEFLDDPLAQLVEDALLLYVFDRICCAQL